jgi:hypothetical protein
MQEHFHKWNTLSQCWGEEAMIRLYRAQQTAMETCVRATALQMPSDVGLLAALTPSHPLLQLLQQQQDQQLPPPHPQQDQQLPPPHPQQDQQLPPPHPQQDQQLPPPHPQQDQQLPPRAFPPPDAPATKRNAANALPTERKPAAGQNSRRTKRSEEPPTSSSSIEEVNRHQLLQSYTDFRWATATKLGNLSCVLAQLGMLDDEGNINLAGYYLSDDLWARQGRAGAAQDPLFVAKLKAGYADCHSLAAAWPQASLDRRGPLHQLYGRLMVFFKCAAEAEVSLCTKYAARAWLERVYGRLDTAALFADEDVAAVSDPYEAAALVMRLKYGTATPEADAVDRFFWGTPDLDW